jgi:hypothetical protein
MNRPQDIFLKKPAPCSLDCRHWIGCSLMIVVRSCCCRVWDSWSAEPGFVRTNFSSKAEYVDLLRRSNFTLCPRSDQQPAAAGVTVVLR